MSDTTIEDVIAQAIKDYFLDVHEDNTDYWEGYVTQWIDTGEFDAADLADRIIERLQASKTVILNVP